MPLRFQHKETPGANYSVSVKCSECKNKIRKTDTCCVCEENHNYEKLGDIEWAYPCDPRFNSCPYDECYICHALCRMCDLVYQEGRALYFCDDCEKESKRVRNEWTKYYQRRDSKNRKRRHYYLKKK